MEKEKKTNRMKLREQIDVTSYQERGKDYLILKYFLDFLETEEREIY